MQIILEICHLLLYAVQLLMHFFELTQVNQIYAITPSLLFVGLEQLVAIQFLLQMLKAVLFLLTKLFDIFVISGLQCQQLLLGFIHKFSCLCLFLVYTEIVLKECLLWSWSQLVTFGCDDGLFKRFTYFHGFNNSIIQYISLFLCKCVSGSSIVVRCIIGMPQNISYTTIASILLKEINKIRNDPKLLIPVLQQRIAKYDQLGNYFPLTGLNFSVKTKEGIAGVRNLINYLENQRECPELNWSYELHQAADKRAHFLSSTQDKNLNRIANLDIGELVSEFVLWKGSLIELTFYGFIQPKQFICELLLEDSHPLKQNRDHFFNRTCSNLGLAISTHPTYRFVVVLILANQVIKHVPFDIYHIAACTSTSPQQSSERCAIAHL